MLDGGRSRVGARRAPVVSLPHPIAERIELSLGRGPPSPEPVNRPGVFTQATGNKEGERT
jgi:hypothetical protein